MKFLSREQYQNVILKEGMKYNSEVYVISYVLKDEKHIIEYLSQYIHNFIILTTSNIKNITLKNFRIYNVDRENCDIMFDSIFNNEELNTNYVGENIVGVGYYIVFVRSKNKNSYVQSANIRKFQFKYLISKLDGFYLDNYIYYNGWGIPRLCEYSKRTPYQYKIIYNGIATLDNNIVVAPLPGIGDYIMFFSMLYEFFQKKRGEGKTVYVVTYQDRTTEIELLNCLFPDVSILMFDNEYSYNYCMAKIDTKNLLSMLFIHIYDSRHKIIQEGQHITQTFYSRLELKTDFQPYKYSKIFKLRILDSINLKEKLYVDNCIANKGYVGIQFFTGIYDNTYDIWTADYTRVWKEEYVRQFVELCNRMNIKLLILGANPYKNLKCKKLGRLSTIGYIYAVSKLKMTVGIDSSAGHIAALYEIPNITIWGRQTPLNLIGNACSFRALKKNISIYSKTGKINNIFPKYVYDILNAVVTGEIETEDKILSYYDFDGIYTTE